MARKITFSFPLALLLIGCTQSSAPINRFQVISNNSILLVDTTTGDSWKLNESGEMWNPIERVPIELERQVRKEWWDYAVSNNYNPFKVGDHTPVNK